MGHGCLSPTSNSSIRDRQDKGPQMTEATGIVFVIDDDASIQHALGGLIRSIGLKVETFGSAKEFLDREPRGRPACITLDIRLRGMSGLDLQRYLVEAQITIPIIFVTGQADVAMSVRAMKAGASDFLTKPFHDQELLDAVVHAVEQDRVRRQQEAEIATLQEHFRSLSPREREVLNGVVSGLLNKQVAAEIGTTEATVKFHRGQLMRKMSADSLADLVRMAVKLEISDTLTETYPFGKVQRTVKTSGTSHATLLPPPAQRPSY
jgi:FixJ family two-component response regulator